MKMKITCFKSSLVGLVATAGAIACLAAKAELPSADTDLTLYWTGNGGDNKWSTVENWASDTNGTALTVCPSWRRWNSYFFKDIAENLVVTQDVTLVMKYLHVSAKSDVQSEVTVRFVSADNCKMSLMDDWVTFHLYNRLCLVLETDMSSDSSNNPIKFQGNGTAARLVFDLKAANTGLRTIRNEGCNRVDVARGSVAPRISFLNGHSVTYPTDTDALVFYSALADETAVYNIVQESGSSNYHPYWNWAIKWRKLFRIESAGSLTIGSTASESVSTNDLSGFVISSGGTVSLSYAKDSLAQFHALPSAQGLSLDRAKYEIVARPAVVRWTFEDTMDPLRDELGLGGLFSCRPDVSSDDRPKIVSDSNRGNVLYFNGNNKCCLVPYDQPNHFVSGFIPNNGFSVAFWIKPDSDCDTLGKLLYFGMPSNNRSFALRLDDQNGLLVGVWGSSKSYGGSSLIGSWHHVAVACRKASDSTWYEYTVYIDGVKAGEALWVEVNIPTQYFWIGSVWEGWSTDGSNPYKGKMDDFLLLDYALTAREVASLKENGVAQFRPVPSVEMKNTANAAFAYTNVTVAALSGESDAASVSVPDGGILTIGSEAYSGESSYAGTIVGNVSLVKNGAGLVQTLTGGISSVTNVSVREGILVLSEPTTSALPADADIDVASGATLKVSSSEKVGFLTGAGTVVVEQGGRLVVENGRGFTGTVTGGGRFKDLSRSVGLQVIVR